MVMKQIKVVTMTDCQEKDLIKIMNGTKKKGKMMVGYESTKDEVYEANEK